MDYIHQQIKLSKLNPGDYQIDFRKKSGFGKYNFVSLKKDFRVEPSFYQSTLFSGLIVTLISILAYALYRVRVRYLLRQKQCLEHEVAERTKEQNNLIDNLEITIAELEDSREKLFQDRLFKEKLSMVMMHDLQSPLRFLKLPNGQLGSFIPSTIIPPASESLIKEFFEIIPGT